MSDSVNTPKRGYHAPRRAAAAAQTREAIARAALTVFERLGWSGATMRGIADEAGVSVKTVEALHRTKTELLKEVVDYAIAGDLQPIPVLGRQSVAAMQAAPDAATMLDLHAHHARDISSRVASIFGVVEQAAPAHDDVAALWRQTCDNRRAGAHWAATTLLTKPGLAGEVDGEYAKRVFWVATEPGTYRSLADGLDLGPDGFEDWLRNYYARMLLG